MEARRSLFVLLLGTCLVLSFAFFQASYLSTQGRPTFPTDDTYIYFQYARQLAEGHPFQYNTGDELTTGMTSILYWLLTTLGYVVGFRGELLVVFAFLLGFAGLFASAWLSYRIVERLVDRTAGMLAAFLVCLNGQVVWGCLAGLEIPVFTSLLLLCILLYLMDRERGNPTRTSVACAVLTLSRPEGLVVGCFVALLLLGSRLRSKIKSRSRFRPVSLWALLPFLTAIAYLLMNKAVAGQFSPTTASTKSMWNFPDGLKILYASSQFILDSARGLFGAAYPSSAEVGFSGSSTVAYFAPFALFFFVVGAFSGCARELKRGVVGGYSIILFVFLLGVGFAALTSANGFQHHRYLIPFYPLFIAGMIAGIHSFSVWIARNGQDRLLRAGIAAYFLLLSSFGLVNAFTQYTFEGVMIRTTTTETADWIRENLKEDEVVGIVDAGILRYFGQRRTVDLLGLTTRRFFARWMAGWGAVVEELSHMPVDGRPRYMVMMPSFGRKTRGIEPLYSVMGEKVYEPWPVFASGQAVFRLDYTALDSGSLPRFESEGWSMVDSLDIGFLADEKRCEYVNLVTGPALRFDVGLQSLSYGDEAATADGGRVVLLGEKFSVRTSPGRPLRVVLRSTRRFRTFRYSPVSDGFVDSEVEDFNPVDMLVDGRRLAGAGIQTPSRDRWHETVLEIPAEFIRKERTNIEIRGSYNSFHYWFYQKAG
jgi:4-amino-4-deoxy-L-arabinose transferase-like glycosyltransferase